jgi:predicted dehydrogenase
VGYIGAGWIATQHLTALDLLDRTTLAGVASATLEHAAAAAEPRGAPAYTSVETMLDEQRPDVAFVSVPPGSSVAICEALVDRDIPFLVEKPLAATDPEGPARLAAKIADRGLVVAVGYHLRALEPLPELRDRLAANPPHLVIARWLDATPATAWWRRGALGGGQVVEQATHLYDIARLLVGEATVVGAASAPGTPMPEGADVADATAAVLRFHGGAIGSFSNTRRLEAPIIEIAFASGGELATIGRSNGGPGDWTVAFHDGAGIWALPPGRDPYERQAEAFLDAVDAGEPAKVFATYADALETYRLTQAVVAATGASG